MTEHHLITKTAIYIGGFIDNITMKRSTETFITYYTQVRASEVKKMTNPKWVKIDKGHYAVSAGAINGKQSFVHVEGNRVYLTDGAYSYIEPIYGSDRTKFMASAKMFAAGDKPKLKLPKISKKTKQQIKTTAKSAVRGAGKVLRTVEAFTTGIGREEEAAYKRRTAQPIKWRRAKPKRAQTLEEYLGF